MYKKRMLWLWSGHADHNNTKNDFVGGNQCGFTTKTG